MIDFIQDNHICDFEGFYRKAGGKIRVKELREKLDKDPYLVKTDLKEFLHEPHVVAGVFKEFFRDLPEPLISADDYHSIDKCKSSYLNLFR